MTDSNPVEKAEPLLNSVDTSPPNKIELQEIVSVISATLRRLCARAQIKAQTVDHPCSGGRCRDAKH
jgi:hypothetical protein